MRNQLEPPSADEEVVITFPTLDEWLDLGQQGHEFAKLLKLRSTQTGNVQDWVISAPVPSMGTSFGAHLFIPGRFTID